MLFDVTADGADWWCRCQIGHYRQKPPITASCIVLMDARMWLIHFLSSMIFHSWHFYFP